MNETHKQDIITKPPITIRTKIHQNQPSESATKTSHQNQPLAKRLATSQTTRRNTHSQNQQH
jgi:hypothetical protein